MSWRSACWPRAGSQTPAPAPTSTRASRSLSGSTRMPGGATQWGARTLLVLWVVEGSWARSSNEQPLPGKPCSAGLQNDLAQPLGLTPKGRPLYRNPRRPPAFSLLWHAGTAQASTARSSCCVQNRACCRRPSKPPLPPTPSRPNSVLLHKQGKLPQAFASLWAHPRLLSAARQLLGDDVGGHPVWNLRCKTPQQEQVGDWGCAGRVGLGWEPGRAQGRASSSCSHRNM